MTQNANHNIRKTLDESPFSDKIVKDSIIFFEFLRKKGIKLKALINLLESEKEEIKRRIAEENENFKKIAKKCPKCNTPMSLFPINTKQGAANIHGYNSKWECPECVFEIYSTDSVYKEISRQKNP